MKCIKHGDKIIRVSDNEAITKVRDGWMYVSKSEYKKTKEKSNGLSKNDA